MFIPFIIAFGNDINGNGTVEDYIQSLKIYPSEPTTASLGQYGEYQMDYSNGLPDISIPLYEVKSGDLTVPIILRYQGGGIKVQQEATWVGLGWDLFFGGQITRTVNGFPDEFEPEPQYRPTADEIISYMVQHKSSIDNNEMSSLADAKSAANSYRPDEYYYNIGMESGKFIGKNVEVMLPYKPIQITGMATVPKITNSIGETYYFTKGETTDINTQYVPKYTSAWYVDSIVSPNNNEIYYEYQTDNKYVSEYFHYYEGFSYSTVEGWNPGNYAMGLTTPKHILLTERKVAKTISSIKKPKYIYFDGGRVSFVLSPRDDISNYDGSESIRKLERIIIERLKPDNSYEMIKSFNFSYSYRNDRLFLDNIAEFSGKIDEELLVTKFQYDPTPLPAKRSFSYDYLGYYNGHNNTSPIPKHHISAPNSTYIYDIGGANKNVVEPATKAGSLISITYPTQGKTVFTWENHRYGAEEPFSMELYLREETIGVGRGYNTNVSCETKYPDFLLIDGDPRISVESFTSYINQTVRAIGFIKKYETENHQHNKYDSGKISVIDITANETIFSKHLINTAINFDELIYLRAGHAYNIIVRSNCNNVGISINFIYNPYNPNEEKYNYPYGGLRVKEITNYDTDGRFLKKKSFTYTIPDSPNKSSGYITNTVSPLLRKYSYHRYKVTIPTPTTLDACFDILNATFFCYDSPISGISANNISYQYVQVQNLDSANNDNNGSIEYEFRKALDFEVYDELLSKSDQRGQLLKESVYDKDNILLKETSNYYSEHPHVNYNSMGFKMRRAFTHDIKKSLCNRHDFDLSTMYVPYNYTYNSLWIKKDSTIVRDFFANNSVISKAEYSYNDLATCLPTGIVSKSSDGKPTKTNIIYPLQMTKSIPFDTKEEYIDNKLMYKTVNKYTAADFLPLKRYQLFLDSVLVQRGENGNLQTELKLKYDKQNNVLEQAFRSNNIVTSYLWSYKNQYPIAKIENATFEQVKAALGYNDNQIEELSVSLAPNTETIENLLRTNLPNALITTYTYKSLVGVSTITDPRGIVTYYEYDGLGRLKEVYYNENNDTGKKRIVENYDYHYKNP